METVNQGTNATENGAQGSAAGEKTFTQAELDKIVGDRLARERQKYEGVDLDDLQAKAKRLEELEEASKTELQKATDRAEKLEKELKNLKAAEAIRAIRQKVAEESGVPENLLTGDTEETCKAQAEAIKAYAKPGYPNVKDGGEPNQSGKQTTREQFADWLNQE